MQFSSADIAALLATVGTDAQIISAAEPPKNIKAKFSRNSMGEYGVLTDKPQMMAAASDLASVDFKNDAVVIGAETFKMTKPIEDNAGFVTVLLARI